jgi:hypothetical protein
MDASKIDIQSLQRIVYNAWRVPLDRVQHGHASPPCETYSDAHHNKNSHRSNMMPITQLARDHDDLNANLCTLLSDWSAYNPRVLLTLENPFNSIWCALPSVQALAEKQNWNIQFESHYCANTSTDLLDGPYPKKPTTWLWHGLPSTFQLSTCNNKCPHRLSDTSEFHKFVICYRSDLQSGQQVIRDIDLKHRIPLGIFQKMWHAFPHGSQSNPLPSSKLESTLPTLPQNSTPSEQSKSASNDVRIIGTSPKGTDKTPSDILQWVKAPKRTTYSAENPAPTDRIIRPGTVASLPHLRRRHKLIVGKTFSQAYLTPYKGEKGKSQRKYNASDYHYDLNNGYINIGKNPPKPKMTAEEHAHLLDCHAELNSDVQLAFMAHTANEPQSRAEAKRSDEWSAWLDAERAEIQQLQELGTLHVVDKVPENKTVYSTKMVYRNKPPCGDQPARKKSRLCVKNFKNTVNDRVFAPVCRIESVRFMLSVAAIFGFKMHHVDICNAFCTAPLQEFIYIKVPDVMLEDDPSLHGKFIEVRKALYGLAISPRAFNKHLDAKLRIAGYKPSLADPCLYYKGSGANASYICLYVDDLLYIGCEQGRQEFQKFINIDSNPEHGFKVRDYGIPDDFLGMHFDVNTKAKTITISQGDYLRSLAKRFNISADIAQSTPLPPGHDLYQDATASPVLADSTEYRSMVGGLMYASHCCRPDACGPVAQFSRYLHAPTKELVTRLRTTIAYFLATADIGITYNGHHTLPTIGYSDANWAGDAATRRSTSGYVFMRANAAITWSSALQRSVAHSTANAEFCALSEAGKEALWLRKLEKLVHGTSTLAPTVIFEDNKSALKWSYDPANHKKLKHVDIAYHDIREQTTEFNNLKVQYVKTMDQLADPLTKNVQPSIFRSLFSKMFGAASSLFQGSKDKQRRGG